jgi:hypothetical protein
LLLSDNTLLSRSREAVTSHAFLAPQNFRTMQREEPLESFAFPLTNRFPAESLVTLAALAYFPEDNL